MAAGAAALPSLYTPDSDLASPDRAGAAAQTALMARFRAAERAPSRSLSEQGTCPSASRGLLSMESGASRRPQRAGNGRAQLGDQAAAAVAAASSIFSPKSSARPRAVPPPHLAPRLGTAGSEPGPPTLVLCVFPASLSFAHTYGFPPLGPCRCGGRDGLASPDQARWG